MPVFNLGPTPAQLGRRKRLPTTEAPPAPQPKPPPEPTPPSTYFRIIDEKIDALPEFDYKSFKSKTLWPTFSAALNPHMELIEYAKRKNPTPKKISIKPPKKSANKKKSSKKSIVPPLIKNTSQKRSSDNIMNNYTNENPPKRKLVGYHFFGPDFNQFNSK